MAGRDKAGPRTMVQRFTVDSDSGELAHYDLYCECGFLSEGWPTKKLAEARCDQHLEEHRTGKPAPPHIELLAGDEATQAKNIADALQAAKAARGRL
jgi:hypothetical protein